MSINSVVISGNLTKDPDMKATQGGTTVMNLSVAVNNRAKQGGEWVDVVSFIDCVMFGTRASAVSQYIRKGAHVTVQGKLKQQRWQDKDGNNRQRVEIIVDDIDFTQVKSGKQPGTANDDYGSTSNINLYEDEVIPF